MHEKKTSEAIKNGIIYIKELLLHGADEHKINKSISWLFGYASHVVMDTTFHPLVNLITKAKYEDAPFKHVECEIHQDSYIFYKVFGFTSDHDIEYFKNGIGTCYSSSILGVYKTLDKDIVEIWDYMMKSTYKDYYDISRPDFNRWYKRFDASIDKGIEFLSLLMGSEHSPKDIKIFPAPDQVDPKYIYNMETPINISKNYIDIFNDTIINTKKIWEKMSETIINQNADINSCSVVGNWNLMTGKDESGTQVYWR